MQAIHEQILLRYRRLRDLSAEMLGHGEAGSWDQVVELKSEHVSEFEALIELEHDVEIEPDFREAKLALLHEINDIDNKLRACLEARMLLVSSSIAQMRNDQRVRHAYKKPAVP